MGEVMIEYSKMTIGELVERADDSLGSPDAIHSLRIAEIKLADRANELNGKLLDCNNASRTIAAKQLDISESANDLAKDLLASNKRSSDTAEKNAEALNNATEQLAKSTRGLNRATWILAIFTGIQVVLAIVNFYLSLQATKP
jgi:predicted  nucleic acid-binding Zn-ribbon protein